MSSRDVVSSKDTPMLSALNLRKFKPLSTAFCRMASVRAPVLICKVSNADLCASWQPSCSKPSDKMAVKLATRWAMRFKPTGP